MQRTDGGVPLRRNRVHLRTTRENFDDPIVHSEDADDVAGPVDAGNKPRVTVPVATPETLSAPVECIVHRSDRVRKQTQFYQTGQ